MSTTILMMTHDPSYSAYLFRIMAELTGIIQFKISPALLLWLYIISRLRQTFYIKTVIEQCRHILTKILE